MVPPAPPKFEPKPQGQAGREISEGENGRERERKGRRIKENKWVKADRKE
jgi:hypothetical protein